MQALKWKQAATVTPESRPGAPLDTSGTANPTLELMGEVDLMRQIDLLTEENERLAKALQQRDEADKKRSERAALDGTGGTLR